MKSIDQVMTHAVRTARPSEVVGPLRDLMLDEGLHAVPIVDPNGPLVGIVTSSDLVEEWAPGEWVANVMTSPVHTTSINATVAEAARVMLDESIHHLPVTDHGEVVGIVSSFDLLRALVIDASATFVRTHGPTARPGDHIVIRSHGVNEHDRRGLIVEARGDANGSPFVVRWLDDPHSEPHDHLFFPGNDAEIEPSAAPQAATT